ncbi:sugar phosphate isomerase/epimerase [Asticcacaulis sp. AC402]|uniref:sugar phosphate isomerase/epimerase family protein n=1 Tax=Asticcacaulis sp. AC402 TaxID=1282361 RepID=UPI0003C3C2CC|nr:sugar phosphate isomerase/epimerase [Asticcacaulis sp. AC402]ESQ77742.1 transcriptional initiation protein Tat [Asticcacaulis sp. AC402]
MNRRHLLLGLSGLAIAGTARAAQTLYDPGVELYTVRDALKADPVGTFKKLHAIGYRHIETSNLAGMTALQFKAALDEADMKATATHVGLSDLMSKPEATLDDNLVLGAKYAVLAWIPQDQRGDWAMWADRMNRWGELAKERGIVFGYHNHDFEFAGKGPEMPFHILLEKTDPDLVIIELDCYWCSLAGHDPVHVLEEHGDRIKTLHLKDKTPSGDMAPVGEGIIPWDKVLTVAKAKGVEQVYVEHDNPADGFASLASSYRYLKG